MVAPLIGAALISGGASIVGGLLGNSAASKAEKAAKYAADKNAEVLREQYGQTRQDLQPYTQGGVSGLNALTSNVPGLLQTQGQGGADYAGYLTANQDVAKFATDAVSQGYTPPGWSGGKIDTPEEAAAYHYQTYGQSEGRTAPTPIEGDPETPYYGPQVIQYGDYKRPEAASGPSAPNLSAENYKASPNYQRRLDEAMRSVAVSSAAGGQYQSGARYKELQDRGADIATDDYNQWVDTQLGVWDRSREQFNTDRAFTNQNFDVDTARSIGMTDTQNNYNTSRFDQRNNDLFRLTGIGANATSALAGAGQNYASGVVQNNNALAGNVGNAAIAGANSTNNAINNALFAWGTYNRQNPNSPTYSTPSTGSGNWGSGWGAGYSSPY